MRLGWRGAVWAQRYLSINPLPWVQNYFSSCPRSSSHILKCEKYRGHQEGRQNIRMGHVHTREVWYSCASLFHLFSLDPYPTFTRLFPCRKFDKQQGQETLQRNKTTMFDIDQQIRPEQLSRCPAPFRVENWVPGRASLKEGTCSFEIG